MASVVGARNKFTPDGNVQVIYLDCGCEVDVPVRNVVLMADLRDWQNAVRDVCLAHTHQPGARPGVIKFEAVQADRDTLAPEQVVQVVVGRVQGSTPPRAPMGFSAPAPAAPAPKAEEKKPEEHKDRFELIEID